MRIGIDARMILATGIGRYTKNLIENLSNIDQKNEYFIFLKSENIGTINLPDNFKEISADFHWYGLTEQLRFPALIKKHRIDLMHFPHFNVPIFYKGKFVVTIHDLTLHKHKTIKASTKNSIIYEVKHFFYKKIIEKAILKSEIIFTPSVFTKTEITKNFKVKDSKIVVTPEGGPSEKMLSMPGNKGILKRFGIRDKFLLYVGNPYPHKNIETLISAMKDISQEVTLVLVGKEDSFYKKIRQEISTIEIKKRIIFTGFVSDSELAQLYRNALLYVFPSLNEGFGLPLLEAAAFGLPIACSGTSSLPEVMGDAALYFNPESKKDIASKINIAIKDKKLRNALKNKGFKRVKEFSWKKMAEDTLSLYNSL